MSSIFNRGLAWKGFAGGCLLAKRRGISVSQKSSGLCLTLALTWQQQSFGLLQLGYCQVTAWWLLL
jgi:hypothetical protein